MAAYKKSNSGYLPFVQKGKVTSPFTDIQNRAKVDSSLKAVFGNERIHVNSLRKLLKESGPNGEVVWESDKQDSRIRFVGDFITYLSTWGQYVQLGQSGDNSSFVEVTFFGTGLNMLGVGYINRDYEIYVDGALNNTVNLSAIGNDSPIGNRNYKALSSVPLVSGLSLGWHTVKIVNITASSQTYSISTYGFEILNESSQMTVKSGKAHGNGYEYELAADELIDYNLGFDNVADIDVGTKGGRAIVYLDPSDGTVKKRLTKVDAAPAYLASADHTNEAPYRVINWREFGRNRGDDFSTYTTGLSDRAFTLDDGTTTLVGNNLLTVTNGAVTADNTGGAFITLTFVGTGLDIFTDATGSGNKQVDIDGVDVGDIAGPTNKGLIKICSGLPYGTHIVKIYGAGAAPYLPIHDFIIYQPKKPQLPEGAIELADYNVMADFVANSTSTYEAVSQGVVRKTSVREFIYNKIGGVLAVGSFFPNRPYTVATSSGASIGDYIEYTFFGTGFDFRTVNGSRAIYQVSLNGVDLTSSNFPTANFGEYGNLTFTSGTGLLDANAGTFTENAGFIVKDLPPNKYTVRFEATTANIMECISLDIITPIHSPNTTFGSLSLKDCRNFDSAKDVNKGVNKENNTHVRFNTVNNTVQGSSNVSQILKTATGISLIYVENTFASSPTNVYTSNYGETVEGTTYGSATSVFDYRTRTSAGADIDAGINSVTMYGKLQKDELEE